MSPGSISEGQGNENGKKGKWYETSGRLNPLDFLRWLHETCSELSTQRTDKEVVALDSHPPLLNDGPWALTSLHCPAGSHRLLERNPKGRSKRHRQWAFGKELAGSTCSKLVSTCVEWSLQQWLQWKEGWEGPEDLQGTQGVAHRVGEGVVTVQE